MDPNLGLTLILILTTLLVVWMKKRHLLQPRIQSFIRTLKNRSRKYGGNIEVVCLQGPLQDQRFRFQHGQLTIGRQRDCDIILNGALVSRQHARLFLSSNSVILQDLDSTNGTWTRGQRVDQLLLESGQPFQIGPTVFMVSPIGQPIRSGAAPGDLVEKRIVSPSVLNSMELHNYERLRVIGEGGAATVYLCRSYDDGDFVAIKILHYSADPYFKKKFQQEGRFGIELQHPNIVRTLGTGESSGLSYIIMEYVPAGSLRDRMVRGPVGVAEAVRISGQICLALDYAHQRKIYHRDIKPENLLFDNNSVAKLADFGIARFTRMRTVTQEGMLIGTPEYMSYEQAKGSDIDGRSDQYALAIVLYEMLCGIRPFRGEPLSVVSQHLSTKPTSPRKINPDVPARIERVIMRSLEKNRNKRYPSSLKMAEAMGFNTGSFAPPKVFREVTPSRTTLPKSGFRLVNTETKHQIALSQETNIVGRNNLRSPHVSRNHAQIIINAKEVVVTDLNSKNGTFVNDVRISGQERLTPGCTVRFGPVRFHFLAD